MSAQPFQLWFTGDRGRCFLLPAQLELSPGPLPISALDGRLRRVAPSDLEPYEITEDEAGRWAKDELGETLDALKRGIDEKLADLRRRLDERNRAPVAEETTVTPSAVPALLDLLRTLPGVVGNSLSKDGKRLEAARTAMSRLQRQLKDSGIDLDDRFTSFPDRLAELRKDTEASVSKVRTQRVEAGRDEDAKRQVTDDDHS